MAALLLLFTIRGDVIDMHARNSLSVSFHLFHLQKCFLIRDGEFVYVKTKVIF